MPGFEALLDHGVLSGWYDTNNTLQLRIHFFVHLTLILTQDLNIRILFRWVVIPWLQQELDVYQDRLNNTVKRHD